MSSDGWEGTIRGKPRVGDSAERSRVVSERDIALFTEITGDRNPLHYDREIAARGNRTRMLRLSPIPHRFRSRWDQRGFGFAGGEHTSQQRCS
jgi:acyl dehydratase